jgi:hypothetical protein
MTTIMLNIFGIQHVPVYSNEKPRSLTEMASSQSFDASIQVSPTALVPHPDFGQEPGYD